MTTGCIDSVTPFVTFANMANPRRALKIISCAAGALSLALAGQAHAIVAFSIGAVGGVDPGLAPGEVPVVTFDTPSAAGIVETDTGPSSAGAAGMVETNTSPIYSVGLFTLTDENVAAAPVGDITQFEAIQPGGAAKFNFSGYAPGVGSLSVYVGSIDSYNEFEVSTNLRNYFYDGTDFLNHDGDQFSHLTNRRVYFQFAPNEHFKSITFASTGIAFEYDTIAAESYPGAQPAWIPTGNDVEYLEPTSTSPAPEPATWTLLLTSFAAVGAVARRRRSALGV
jgi:hypothetical protein